MVETKKETVEEQLALYRKRKRREEELSAMKQRLWNALTAVFTIWKKPRNSETVKTTAPAAAEEPQDKKEEALSTEVHDVKRHRQQKKEREEDNTMQEKQPPLQRYTKLDWVMLLLKVLMWLLLQKVFILLEFGAVFFIFTAFMFIWYNMRNEPKKKGEASAYSVFNPNCEAIDGTFTAEQFERELLHKM